MTTASTSTTVSHAATANFRVWAAEIIAQLLAVGLTQTADTGQINTATVAKPAVNTSAGYAIFRFNDTAQATSPVFMRIEFGTGAGTTVPRILITVGTGTNGAGVINGTVLDQVAVTNEVAPASTVTAYTSRFCYNATMGFLGLVWKLGGGGTGGVSLGGFFIYRSTNAAGASTTDAIMLITNSPTVPGSNGYQGAAQALSYLTSVAYNSAILPWPSAAWAHVPFLIPATLYAGNVQVFPIFQYTPILGINASCAIALMSEIALGGTVTGVALVGAATHTFLQVGGCFGAGNFTAQNLGSSFYGVLMLWE